MVLSFDNQAPQNLRIAFQSEILDASNHAAELVRSLGKDISNMRRTPKSTSLLKVHVSTERLQRAIDIHSYLLTSCHDDLSNNSKPLAKLSHTLSSNVSFNLDKAGGSGNFELPTNLSFNLAKAGGSGNFELPANPPQQLTDAAPAQAESYHEVMKKQMRRLHSWPSRELDAFDEGGPEMDSVPKMRALESTAALSLATFTSLLIEFVARLDHLVDSVNELAQMAKFKHDNT